MGDYIKSEQIGGGSCFKCLLFLYIIVEQWRRSGGYIKSEQIGGGSCFKCLLFLYIIVEQ